MSKKPYQESNLIDLTDSPPTKKKYHIPKEKAGEIIDLTGDDDSSEKDARPTIARASSLPASASPAKQTSPTFDWVEQLLEEKLREKDSNPTNDVNASDEESQPWARYRYPLDSQPDSEDETNSQYSEYGYYPHRERSYVDYEKIEDPEIRKSYEFIIHEQNEQKDKEKKFQALLSKNPRIYIYQGNHGTIHGEMGCQFNTVRCRPKVFTMPEGVTMKFVALSSPGALCYNDRKYIKYYLSKLKEIKERNKHKSFDSEDIDKGLQEIATYYNTIRDPSVFKVSDIEDYDIPEKKADIEFYYNNLQTCAKEDKSYSRIVTVNPGDKMLNYEYTTGDIHIMDSIIDDGFKMVKMHIIDFDDDDDSFLNHHDSDQITLAEIIAYLTKYGVREIVYINGACSPFPGTVTTDYKFGYDSKKWGDCRTDFISMLSKNNIKFGGKKTKKRRRHSKTSKKKNFKRTHKRHYSKRRKH